MKHLLMILTALALATAAQAGEHGTSPGHTVPAAPSRTTTFRAPAPAPPPPRIAAPAPRIAPAPHFTPNSPPPIAPSLPPRPFGTRITPSFGEHPMNTVTITPHGRIVPTRVWTNHVVCVPTTFYHNNCCCTPRYYGYSPFLFGFGFGSLFRPFYGGYGYSSYGYNSYGGYGYSGYDVPPYYGDTYATTYSSIYATGSDPVLETPVDATETTITPQTRGDEAPLTQFTEGVVVRLSDTEMVVRTAPGTERAFAITTRTQVRQIVVPGDQVRVEYDAGGAVRISRR